MATAGSDNRVRIWAMGPIMHEAQELDASKPRLLATLAEHIGAVNVARFSKSGKYIASGSDDKLVIVHQLLPGSGKPLFGSNEPPSVENWRQVKAMRGHSSNVADIAWSPDDRMIASASLDNNVIIWDVETGQQVKTLQGHFGCVKGVAWDPFNVYLATQGEQDGIFIWKTDTWSPHKKIKEPLGELVGSTAWHYRLNWSPDGQLLAGTVAYDKPCHQSILIERRSWEAPFNYSGHRGPVCVARFNPHLFYPHNVSGLGSACVDSAPACARGTRPHACAHAHGPWQAWGRAGQHAACPCEHGTPRYHAWVGARSARPAVVRMV
jgi:protein HIRA/HIR1